MDLLPLEKLLERNARDHSLFPRLKVNYFELYKGLVSHLKTSIYKDIDSGLAANSKIPGFYTAHNAEHFDEVVHHAGMLLGVETGEEYINLTAYETYILLVAIRVHDVGNIYGREGHEKKCFTILKNMGPISGDDDAEKKIIAKIAQAHGGKNSLGSNDTISELVLNSLS